jgi:hypothetical protein
VKETPYSLVRTSDGGFLLAGSSNSFFPRFGPYLIKTSASGDLSWSRRIFLADETGFQYRGSATFARELVPGEFLVSGWLEMAGAEGFDVDGFLMHINSEGEQQWFRRIGPPSGEDAIWGFDLTPDNEIVVLGSAPLLNVFSVDLSGQVSWSNRLAPLAWGNQIVVDSNGSAVITGYAAGTPGPAPDALLVKLDTAGQTGCDQPLHLRVLEGAPTFDSPPTQEGMPSVTARDYSLQVSAAMKSTQEVCRR